jgi:serine/threonine protein kinase
MSHMGWEEERQGPHVALERPVSTPIAVESVDDPWAPTPPETEPNAAGFTEGAPVLSRFQVLRPLGAGGQGRVFAALDRAAGERRVALKVMPRRGDRAAEQRLIDEFVIMRRVRHPAVVEVFDAGLSRDHVWVALELVEGLDLHRANHEPSFGLAARLRAIADLARGVAHVHGLGVVHCDLKPANALLSTSGRVKLIDFGIARVSGRPPSEALGTPQYVAPEVITENRRDERADIFSLGVMAFELLTGGHPWVGANQDRVTILRTMLSRPPLALLRTATLPWLDLDEMTRYRLSAIVNRAICAEPRRRFPTAIQFAEALEELLGDRPS